MKKVIFLCLVLLFSVGTKAEESEEITKSRKIYQLEPVIVTATRYPEYLKNIPTHSTSLSFSKLKNFNLLSLGEVLKNFSAGEVNSSGSLGQSQTLSLRGSSSSQVLFLLEGRRLNYVANGIFNLSDFPLENLEKIEIVRGPLSSLYGANALGGVVNLIPALPLKRNLSFSIQGGEENTFISSINFNSGIKNLRFNFGLEKKDSDGERKNSDYSALFFHSNLFYRLSSKADLKLYLLTQKDDLGLPGPVPDPLNISKFGNSEVSSLFDHQKDKNFSLDLTFNVRSDEKSQEVLTRLFFDRRRLNYSTKYEDYSLGEAEVTYSYLTKSLGGFMQYSFLAQDVNRILFGLDFSADCFEARKSSYFVTSQKDSIFSWSPSSNVAFGLWGNSNWKIGRFTFQLGTRYDLPSNFEKSFSPNLGIIYHLKDNLSLKFNYGKAYRAPTFNDLYWPDEGYGRGNKDLKPEKGKNFEAGFSFSSNKISSQASLFYRNVKNLISWQPLGENGLWQPFNLDRFNSKGIELELDYKFSESFDFDLNYSYNRGEEIKKELVYDDFFSGEKRFEELKRKARFLPENIFNLNLNLKIFSSFSTQVSFNYRSKKLSYYPDYSSYPDIKYLTKKLPAFANFDLNFNQVIKNFT
ncbi:MAG: TonB-dependent receptor, partial [candidate division Zixibacteria bacterium]|nr:TonB-dependent receptor [candidate division Zixibacteria bacterium]